MLFSVGSQIRRNGFLSFFASIKAIVFYISAGFGILFADFNCDGISNFMVAVVRLVEKVVVVCVCFAIHGIPILHIPHKSTFTPIHLPDVRDDSLGGCRFRINILFRPQNPYADGRSKNQQKPYFPGEAFLLFLRSFLFLLFRFLLFLCLLIMFNLFLTLFD